MRRVERYPREFGGLSCTQLSLEAGDWPRGCPEKLKAKRFIWLLPTDKQPVGEQQHGAKERETDMERDRDQTIDVLCGVSLVLGLALILVATIIPGTW